MSAIWDYISQLFLTVSSGGGLIWEYALYLFVVISTGAEFLRTSDHPCARYLVQVLRLEDVVGETAMRNSFVGGALMARELGPHHFQLDGDFLRLIFDEQPPACPMSDFILESAATETSSAGAD